MIWIVTSAAVPVDAFGAPVDGVIGEAPIPGSMEADEEGIDVGDPGDELGAPWVVPQALAPMTVAAPIRATVRR
ncbi:hypothetical protein QK292_17800 [Arthrobacter sp. AL08]|uniref:hypothetical protein n=1 Tax=Micrococcaceae TaxID=1268 RepID=UPI001CFFD79E|nr:MULTISPECIES: hypothetical protein [Micrococcaceae]MDI3243398.1 hypothetical protein [Arthrobacter sp. AL05]MDI3279407.1 hypothetical protein [Arthrobacter sp. AL08]MDJ0354341.1 hypothetical protein [Pseudarthrobacter sp. PH31-O2]WGZ80736.1 hypothetical protein QI450_05980 [Arthrobacter sp. EM1]